MTDYDIEAAVEELTAPTTFNLKEALAKKTSPEESVTVYLDGKTMHEINIITDEIVELESQLNTYKAAQNGVLANLLAEEKALKADSSGGITDDPEIEVVQGKIAKHKKETTAGVKKREKAIKERTDEGARLILTVRESSLKFKLRGLIPKQFELIISKWERKFKEPARGDFENETDWQHTFNEKLKARNRAIQVDQIRTSIVSVTGSDGVEHGGGWTYQEGSDLWDELDRSEKDKLGSMSANLSFALTLFDRVATEDADFLPKP